MTSVQSPTLAGALGHFRLRNIWLRSAHFTRPNDLPSEPETEFVRQSRRSVSVARQPVSGVDNARELLFVIVELGTRVKARADSDPRVCFEIEADFVAQYELAERVADERIQQFAELDAVSDVWPFWRQHVFDIVQRGGLPPVEIPLSSGHSPGDCADTGAAHSSL